MAITRKPLNEAMAEQTANGAVAGADFSGVARNQNTNNDPLVPGDEFTIPEDYEANAISVKFSTEEDAKAYPCLLVPIKGADGDERWGRFFPNQLAKNITPLDAQGRRMPKVKTKGTAAAKYAEFANAGKSQKEALDALKGRTIRVTNAEQYTVFKFQSTTETQTSTILTYDLV